MTIKTIGRPKGYQYPLGLNAISVRSTFANVATNTTGGTQTMDGLYAVHTFNANDTFSISFAGEIDILIVGGGGGGGGQWGGGGGGGGGAGGLVYLTGHPISGPGNISIEVGTGGAGGLDYSTRSANGKNSYFSYPGPGPSTRVALGGGGGGSYGAPDEADRIGHSGGSGGGGGSGSSGVTNPGGETLQYSTYGYGYGNAGGTADQGSPTYAGGGGGGAGAAGAAGGNVTAGSQIGGYGLAYSISGTSTYYAGGGSGGGYTGPAAPSTLGGGAAGSIAGSAAPGVDGLGGGGGGAGASPSSKGGNGGRGVVIVRYLAIDPGVYSIN